MSLLYTLGQLVLQIWVNTYVNPAELGAEQNPMLLLLLEGTSFPTCFVYVIARARGQLRINFTRIFKVFTKLPESRSDEGNLENFENTSEINP